MAADIRLTFSLTASDAFCYHTGMNQPTLSQALPQRVADCLASVGTQQGDARLQQYLLSLPFPHYEVDPDDAHLLIRVDESGQKTRGHFVNRRFIKVEGSGR